MRANVTARLEHSMTSLHFSPSPFLLISYPHPPFIPSPFLSLPLSFPPLSFPPPLIPFPLPLISSSPSHHLPFPLSFLFPSHTLFSPLFPSSLPVNRLPFSTFSLISFPLSFPSTRILPPPSHSLPVPINTLPPSLLSSQLQIHAWLQLSLSLRGLTYRPIS